MISKQKTDVSLVNPSYQLTDISQGRLAMELLEKKGLSFVVQKDVFSKEKLFAGSLERRYEELEWSLGTTSKFIWCGRGGYGATQLLDRKLLQKIRGSEKVFMGFSDTTALLLIGAETGYSIHGPHWGALPKMSTSEEKILLKIITRKQYPERAFQILPWNDSAEKNRSLVKGKLLGGNLSLLTASCGTDWFPKDRNIILFLEDIDEPLHRIDRMLVQLKQAGLFERVSAVVLGDFSAWQREKFRGKWNLKMVFREFFPDIPVWGNFPAGHGKFNKPVLLGAKVTISKDHVLRIPETNF